MANGLGDAHGLIGYGGGRHCISSLPVGVSQETKPETREPGARSQGFKNNFRGLWETSAGGQLVLLLSYLWQSPKEQRARDLRRGGGRKNLAEGCDILVATLGRPADAADKDGVS